MKHPPRAKTYHQSTNTQRSRNYFDTLCLAEKKVRNDEDEPYGKDCGAIAGFCDAVFENPSPDRQWKHEGGGNHKNVKPPEGRLQPARVFAVARGMQKEKRENPCRGETKDELADPSFRPLPGEDDLCDICIDDHDIDYCERSQRVVNEDSQAFRILSKTVEPLQIFRNTCEKEPCIQNTERHDPEFGVPFAGHIHSEELIDSSERESKAKVQNMRVEQGSEDAEEKRLVV